MRAATYAIISLRRSASEPFSRRALSVILSMVMDSFSGWLRWATRTNLESDHDRLTPRPRVVDGSSYIGLDPPTTPPSRTPPPGTQPSATEEYPQWDPYLSP